MMHLLFMLLFALGCGIKSAVPCPTGFSIEGSRTWGDGRSTDVNTPEDAGKSAQEWNERSVTGGVYGEFGRYQDCPIWNRERNLEDAGPD